MAQPALTGHARPPSSRPLKPILPHARAPPPDQRHMNRGQLHGHGFAAPFPRGEVQQMKRRIAVVALVFAAVALIAQQALAVSPHFISASGTLNNNGTLTVNFKEAGLGTNQNITYVASADATATYVCVNNGGGNPSAQNKTTVAGPVSATGTFNSGKNGNVTASLTLNPPPSDISCPKGQTLQLAQVSYTNVAITDTTNNITEPVPGTFNSGCLLPNVRGAC
jgi:hypothetical protein